MFDWTEMQTYIDAGNGFLRCHARFGIAHATWIKAIRAGDIRVDASSRSNAGARRRYDWQAVQAFYDAGNTYRQCMERFGFCPAAWTKAVNRGVLRARARRQPLMQVLQKGERGTVKRHLLEAGILENRCSWCGIDRWRGLPISIQIDHINGVRDDNRIENLRMLCPNCHSQTETFAARNAKNRRSLIPVGVIGNTSDSDSEDLRFDPLTGSHGPIV